MLQMTTDIGFAHRHKQQQKHGCLLYYIFSCFPTKDLNTGDAKGKVKQLKTVEVLDKKENSKEHNLNKELP